MPDPGDRKGGRPGRTPPLPGGSRRSGAGPGPGGRSPRAGPAAQDAVFRRLLPMARAVAVGAVPAGGPVDPGAGERAAESGLARAVARWWSADGAGFEVFASITIAVELDRLSATASDRGPVTAVADRQDEPLTGHPRE